ncbi:MAG: LytTR family DNA-binding domain-containing protein [Oscillospiraceae bacterium]
MNIAVIDDSAIDRGILKAFIKSYAEESKIQIDLKEFSSGEDFSKSDILENLHAAFFDIYMDKLNGIDCALMLRRINERAEIIFTTTSNSFAAESYSVRAADYLLKPLNYEKIIQVMDLIVKKQNIIPPVFKICEKRSVRRILISDILYVDTQKHYVCFHTKKGIESTYILSFQQVEEELRQYKNFLTCYRNTIVNMDEIDRTEERDFILSTGEYVPINRNDIYNIKDKYRNYMFWQMESGE